MGVAGHKEALKAVMSMIPKHGKGPGTQLKQLHGCTPEAAESRCQMLHFMLSLMNSAKLHQREGLMDIAALKYYR